MSVIAISFLLVGCSVLLVAFAAIYKKHSRTIFWSGAIALFLSMCALFATGVFKPEIGNVAHNAVLLSVTTLMLGTSAVLIMMAEKPEMLFIKYWRRKNKTKKSAKEKAVKTTPHHKEHEPDMICEGVFIPKELDTPLARKVFEKAIEQGLMKEDGHYYRWSEKESKVLLAYMCGRVYCRDVPEYDEKKRKYYWMDGKWGTFPDSALNNLFQTKDLSISRTNRIYAATPHKSKIIDEIIDQCKGE